MPMRSADAVADAGGTATGRLPAAEVAGALRDHDIACVLSKNSEPFSLAVLEAMASGCAVITTGTGGITEVVGDSAELVGVDDVEAVAAAIAALTIDPQLLVRAEGVGPAPIEVVHLGQGRGQGWSL